MISDICIVCEMMDVCKRNDPTCKTYALSLISEKVKEAWKNMTDQERKLIPVLFPMSTIEFSHKETCELMDLRTLIIGKSPL